MSRLDTLFLPMVEGENKESQEKPVVPETGDAVPHGDRELPPTDKWMPDLDLLPDKEAINNAFQALPLLLLAAVAAVIVVRSLRQSTAA